MTLKFLLGNSYSCYRLSAKSLNIEIIHRKQQQRERIQRNKFHNSLGMCMCVYVWCICVHIYYYIYGSFFVKNLMTISSCPTTPCKMRKTGVPKWKKQNSKKRWERGKEKEREKERGKETGFPTNPASSTMFYTLIYQCSPPSRQTSSHFLWLSLLLLASQSTCCVTQASSPSIFSQSQLPQYFSLALVFILKASSWSGILCSPPNLIISHSPS